MIAAMAALTMNDAIVKAVSAEMNFGQIMLLRGSFAIVLIAALAWHQQALRPLRTLKMRRSYCGWPAKSAERSRCWRLS